MIYQINCQYTTNIASQVFTKIRGKTAGKSKLPRYLRQVVYSELKPPGGTVPVVASTQIYEHHDEVYSIPGELG